MTDLVLAILHHGLAFFLVSLIAIELALIRPGLRKADMGVLARVDAAYGIAAVALIVIGVGRVHEGLKGWEFYVYNPVFWLKMASFAGVGLLSIQPTLRILRWRRAATAGQDLVPEAEIRAVRTFLKAEAAGIALILIFAAAMARGYGI